MSLLDAVTDALNQRKNLLLQAAEIVMPPWQFQAFRKFFLDQFGRNGFEGDLIALIEERQGRNGTGRPIHAKKEVDND